LSRSMLRLEFWNGQCQFHFGRSRIRESKNWNGEIGHIGIKVKLLAAFLRAGTSCCIVV
jgi:hypothetical protein